MPIDSWVYVSYTTTIHFIGQNVTEMPTSTKSSIWATVHSQSISTSDHTIYPALLFQRHIVISRAGDVSLEEALRYELSPFPSALIIANNTSRKADRPQLAKAIYEYSIASQMRLFQTKYQRLNIMC